MKRLIGLLLMLCLMAACSDPDQGPPLGAFAAITKTETDAPFNLTPPTSKSPAPFNFSSSDPKVATVSGSLVTITGPGETTITAYQNSVGGWGPTSATTKLTVTAVPCEAGSVRVGGVCSVKPTCIPPASLDSGSNKCLAPATTATVVTFNGLSWAGVSSAGSWSNASAFCTSTTIEGADGWRQPTAAELSALYASGAIAGHGWTLGNTWSSTMGTEGSAVGHLAVNLATGAAAERGDDLFAYFSCVRAAE